MRDNDDGHGSPPPILVFERGWSDRDALAGDVVQDVDLVRERATGEDLEDLERGFQRRVRAPGHQLLDCGALESLHQSSSKVAVSLSHRPGRGQGGTPTPGNGRIR